MVCTECKWGTRLLILSPVEKHITPQTNPVDLVGELLPAAGAESKWQDLALHWQVSVPVGINPLFLSYPHWSPLRLPLSELFESSWVFETHPRLRNTFFWFQFAVSRGRGLLFTCWSWRQRKSNEFPNLVCSKSGLSQIRSEIRSTSEKITASTQMHVLSEQIKLTFKINVKSHPCYAGRQAPRSGVGRAILRWAMEANSQPSVWPGIRVLFYLLSPIISLLLEDICYCLITRTASRSAALVGSQGFWQLWEAAASWTVSHLTQSRHVPPMGLWPAGRMPGVWGVSCSHAEPACTCAQAVACTGAASRPPAAIASPLRVGMVGFSLSIQGWENPSGRWALPFPSSHISRRCNSHLFLAPAPPCLKKNIQGDSCVNWIWASRGFPQSHWCR